MEVKPGYKLTDVGVIPEEWDVTKVGIAGEVLGGRQRSPHAVGEPCRYLRVANVFDGFIDTSDVLEMPFTAREKERFLLKDGDILLNEGQSLELVGRSAIYRGDPAGCCFQNTLVRFRAYEGTSPEFAQVVFQRYLVTGVFASIASQTTSIAHLGAGRFANLPFPLPPLREQQAIAAALGDVDVLIGSLDRLIVKKRDLKQAAMQQLLTGEQRLPGFSDEWEATTVAKLGSFSKGRGIKKDEVVADGKPCVRYGEIYTHHNDYVRRFFSFIPDAVAAQSQPLKNGDLLFAGSGETSEEIGKCVAYLGDEAAYAGGDIVLLSPLGHDSKFLGYLMNSEYVRVQKARMGQGDAVVHIGARHLGQIMIRVPKKDEQAAIAEVISDMDAEIATLEARRDKTKLLKEGMMQELLTGRTRLI